MIFLLDKKTWLIWMFFKINLKLHLRLKTLYFWGKYGYFKYNIELKDLFNLKKVLKNFFYDINVGWVNYLMLNGLGFKATRKISGSNKKYWRFNVGHSHVFQYFTPNHITMKVKQRWILIFGLKKNQISDISKKIKSFHLPDCYKGVGLKYPKELIRLKKGKVRQ